MRNMKTTLTRCLALLFCLWGSNAFTQAPPVNDLCANAIDLVCGTTVNGTLKNATPTPGYQLLNDVWYKISNVTGTIKINTCSTAVPIDTWLRVYKPTISNPACQPGMTLVADNDNFCNPYDEVSWTAVAGETYYIQVRDFGPAVVGGQVVANNGDFSITAICNAPTVPSNDLCANAINVQCGSIVNGTTVGATIDLNSQSPGVWYRIVGNGNYIVASLCGPSTYDNAISIVQGSCQNTSVLASDNNSCGNGTSATVTFYAAFGTDYFILVNGAGAASGNFQLSMTCLPPPSNDICTNPVPVTCNSITPGTTIGATGASTNGADVWYSFVGTGNLVTASLCGSNNFDTYLQIAPQATGGLTCTAATPSWTNDDACGQDAEITFMTQWGVTYLIRVAGFQFYQFGNFTLTMTCDNDNIPNNDNCVDAKPIRCGGEYYGTTRNATSDVIPVAPNPNVPNSPTSMTTKGVWYVFQGTGGIVTFSTCSSQEYDSYLRIYTGNCNSLNSLVEVAQDDDGCGLDCRGSLSAIVRNFQTTLGVTYYILVSGYGNATGNFVLKVLGTGCSTKLEKACGPGKTDALQLTKVKSTLDVTIYPNPSVGQVDFDIAVDQAGAAQLRIIDLTGQVVVVRDLGELEVGQHKVRHDWQGIAAGIYLYQIQVGDARVQGKLQVLR
jgi:hypothetical protein